MQRPGRVADGGGLRRILDRSTGADRRHRSPGRLRGSPGNRTLRTGNRGIGGSRRRGMSEGPGRAGRVRLLGTRDRSIGSGRSRTVSRSRRRRGRRRLRG
ncbi:hypothetical protein, partial [Streptomyces sp. SID5785]|uniref:hypothetical protein n=1 Tax=Streptomyces sp. SID5785 TaxID=2690309 RepID=UPI001F17FC2A